MLFESLEHPEPHVRERADRQGDAFSHEPLHDRGILEAADPVVDPLRSEGVEGAGDRGGRPLLARVGHGAEPQRPALRKHAPELLRRVAPLARVEPHADELLPVGCGLLQGFEGLVLAQVAEEAHDQGRRDAELRPRPLDRPRQPRHHRLEGHAAGGVGLRVEEDLGPDHVVGLGPLQIRPGQLEKVLLVEEHGRGGVVDVQKTLQVAEGVGTPHRLGIGVGEGDAVAFADREGHLGLQRALDVEMQFGLGRGGHERRQPGR